MTNTDRGQYHAPRVKDDPTDNHTRLRPWLALAHTPGMGCRRIKQLVEQIPEPHQLFQPGHPAQELLSPKIRPQLAALDCEQVEQDLNWLAQSDSHHIVYLHDPRYPYLLREISDPPPILYINGDANLLSQPQLAIVGSRTPSQSGHQLAINFARFFCQSGLLVTSGLAAGIDGAAHKGALQANGPTLAVIGTGPDRVYPAHHRDLAHKIATCGAIISEFSPGTPPVPANFPRRNRIISGLSLGTLVVEAAKRSGSLITARLAAEQGREVFAIPGSIHNPLARGCHALIRQGAKLVETAEDVVEELGALFQASQKPPEEASKTTTHNQDGNKFADPDYQKLLSVLGFDPITADELIQRSGLTAEAVSSMLLLLELDGFVCTMPGGRYSRTGSTDCTTAPQASN